MGAKCSLCKVDMTSDAGIKGWTFTHLQFGENGEIFERNSTHFDESDYCHDCRIENKKGRFHHIFCDVERCPKCGGQLISCGCFGTDTYAIIAEEPAKESLEN